ncbi:MAG: hypothetical protein IIY78_02490, partial [Clostridia bacterium]|nr:hypothetical protein [Clostridia bacterium]
MSNTPQIRFAGFTDDWEQRKLGDEAIEILAGGDIDKDKTVENGKATEYEYGEAGESLSSAVKQALLDCFAHVAWIEDS